MFEKLQVSNLHALRARVKLRDQRVHSQVSHYFPSPFSVNVLKMSTQLSVRYKTHVEQSVSCFHEYYICLSVHSLVKEFKLYPV
jgi:hypothetical protein